jgi:hypothetical protein
VPPSSSGAAQTLEAAGPAEHELYGTIPLLNWYWHHLSAAAFTSLALTFTSATSPRSLTCWLQNHPHASLQHLSLDFKQKQNKHLRCGSRAGLQGRNDETHHWMEPKRTWM